MGSTLDGLDWLDRTPSSTSICLERYVLDEDVRSGMVVAGRDAGVPLAIEVDVAEGVIAVVVDMEGEVCIFWSLSSSPAAFNISSNFSWLNFARPIYTFE